MPWLTKNEAQIKSGKKVSKSYHHNILHAAPNRLPLQLKAVHQSALKLIRSLLLSVKHQHTQSFFLNLEKASVFFPLWANQSFCTKTTAHRRVSHNKDCVVLSSTKSHLQLYHQLSFNKANDFKQQPRNSQFSVAQTPLSHRS